jgi:hypothetical protein
VRARTHRASHNKIGPTIIKSGGHRSNQTTCARIWSTPTPTPTPPPPPRVWVFLSKHSLGSFVKEKSEAARLATAAVGHACNNDKGLTSGCHRQLPKGGCKHLAHNFSINNCNICLSTGVDVHARSWNNQAIHSSTS